MKYLKLSLAREIAKSIHSKKAYKESSTTHLKNSRAIKVIPGFTCHFLLHSTHLMVVFWFLWNRKFTSQWFMGSKTANGVLERSWKVLKLWILIHFANLTIFSDSVVGTFVRGTFYTFLLARLFKRFMNWHLNCGGNSKLESCEDLLNTKDQCGKVFLVYSETMMTLMGNGGKHFSLFLTFSLSSSLIQKRLCLK